VYPIDTYVTVALLDAKGNIIKADAAGNKLSFAFSDSNMATRVGKAFVHASELCGAKAAEPF
jgi:hypothetical protein